MRPVALGLRGGWRGAAAACPPSLSEGEAWLLLALPGRGAADPRALSGPAVLGLNLPGPSSSTAGRGKGGYSVSRSVPESVFTQCFFKSSEVGGAAVRKGVGFRLLEVLYLTRGSGLPDLCAYLLHLVSPSVAFEEPTDSQSTSIRLFSFGL